MPDFELLTLLLSSIDRKQILLLRYYEIQIELLHKRLDIRLLPDDYEKAALSQLAHEIGRKDLEGRSNLFHPETLMRWHREQVASKFDGSAKRGPGRPSSWHILERLVLRLSRENTTWGCFRIAGQLHTLGYSPSPETIRRIFLRHGMNPDPDQRQGMRWSDFIERHKPVLTAADFFSAEVWENGRLETFYCFFLIHLNSRQVEIAGITKHPDEAWMKQIARNLTGEGGFLNNRQWLLLDRDTKYSKGFRDLLTSSGIHCLRLPWRSPNLNAFAERWIRSVKEECLRNLIFTSESMLRNALKEYLAHYHTERTHQGLGNTIPFPDQLYDFPKPGNSLQSKSRLGGLLNFYYWQGEIPNNEAA